MAQKAFMDKKKKGRIYRIDEVTGELHSSIFYCPNIECGAILTACGVQSSTKFKPRFRAKTPHIEGCPYKVDGQTKHEKYDTDTLNWALFRKSIFNSNSTRIKTNKPQEHLQRKSRNSRIESESNKFPLKVQALYAYCKHHSKDDAIGEPSVKILQILVDERSNYFYKKGIFGMKLVECAIRTRHYDSSSQEFFLKYPYSGNGENKYNIVLRVADAELYKILRNKLFNNLNPVVVYAYWKNEGTQVVANISTSEQIYISPNK